MDPAAREEEEEEEASFFSLDCMGCLLSSSFQSAATPIAIRTRFVPHSLRVWLPSPSTTLFIVSVYIWPSGFPEMTQPCLYSTWLCHFASPIRQQPSLSIYSISFSFFFFFLLTSLLFFFSTLLLSFTPARSYANSPSSRSIQRRDACRHICRRKGSALISTQTAYSG